MFGLDDPLGHLCGGGTMANLEALWVAGRLKPETTIVASTQAHYTHARISDVLALDFESVPVSGDGRMNVEALSRRLEMGDVGTVVATLGTTGFGAIDPLAEIVELRKQHHFRIHVDAAYGGYFTLADNLDPVARDAFDAIVEADSIVIDPHKHGLQPYGCGCVLFRDRGTGALYKHDSPYTYFSSAELHLGEISLECSRPGAAAVALWATQQLLPMDRGGKFGNDLGRSLQAAQEMWGRVRNSGNFHALMKPELDIVVFAVNVPDARRASDDARKLFEAAAKKDLHLALIEVPMAIAREHWPELVANRESLTCLRSCLMKTEHLDWIDDIWSTLDVAASGLHH
jgi:glutamate/tyrosine decarboxylase-like PLP-dependent enzyme